MLDMSDLEELNRKLDKKLAQLDREEKRADARDVPLNTLLTPAFISKNTCFADVDEMFQASGFHIESQADFEAIPEDQWNAFIRSNSDFPDWESMLGAAGGEWATGKLDL